MSRLRRVRDPGDQGSALAIALVFLMVFGLLIGVVLQFASVGQRTALSVRDEATNTYSGGGALDGAINALRGTLTAGVAGGPCPSFTMPAGRLGNPSDVTVSCTARPTSGTPTAGSTLSQPASAVTALSSTANEGVSVGSGTTTLKGGAAVNKAITVAAGATLDSTGYPVVAGTCPAAGTGTVEDACSVGSGATDPGYPGPSTSVADQETSLPACATTVTLQPGIYRSATALQAVLDCNNATIVLATGTYYFDFQNAGSHELVFNGAAPRNSIIVGGARSGTSCVPGSPGVDLAFGGDSRLRVQSGKVDLCALVPLANTTQQHIVLRGLSTSASVPTTGAATGASASSTGGTAFSNANSGALVDGSSARVSRIEDDDSDAVLRVLLPTALVPADATNISLTFTVRESLERDNSGDSATSTAELRTSGGTLLATRPLRSCPASACTGTMLTDPPTAMTPITGITATNLNGGARIDVRIHVINGRFKPVRVDGVVLALTYNLPIRPVCQLVTPAGACTAGSAPTNPLLTASGTYTATPLALHGTIYAPTSSVNLGMTAVNTTVVDRGVVVRHLVLSMTPAAGAPALISIPDLVRVAREVILVATDASGTQLARAAVIFADLAGTGNGAVTDIVEWSVE